MKRPVPVDCLSEAFFHRPPEVQLQKKKRKAETELPSCGRLESFLNTEYTFIKNLKLKKVCLESHNLLGGTKLKIHQSIHNSLQPLEGRIGVGHRAKRWSPVNQAEDEPDIHSFITTLRSDFDTFSWLRSHYFIEKWQMSKIKKKRRNFSCKLGKNTEHMTTKLSRSERRQNLQQAMQWNLVITNIKNNKNWKK